MIKTSDFANYSICKPSRTRVVWFKNGIIEIKNYTEFGRRKIAE